MTFYYRGNSLDGVVNYLKKINQLNLITVEVSGVYKDYYKEYIFEDSPNETRLDHWVANTSNGYVIFTFNYIQPILTHYSIKSNIGEEYNLKSWITEGSNDKIKWTLLHSINGTNDLANHSIKTYKVDNDERNAYRYYRISKTCTGEIEDELMRVADVEFFGIFFNIPTCFCEQKIFHKTLLMSIFIIFRV